MLFLKILCSWHGTVLPLVLTKCAAPSPTRSLAACRAMLDVRLRRAAGLLGASRGDLYAWRHTHTHTPPHTHTTVTRLAPADHFPDAFEGKSTKLRDTLVNLVLDKPDEWHTQVALPFVKIEGTVRSHATPRKNCLLIRSPTDGLAFANRPSSGTKCTLTSVFFSACR